MSALSGFKGVASSSCRAHQDHCLYLQIVQVTSSVFMYCNDQQRYMILLLLPDYVSANDKKKQSLTVKSRKVIKRNCRSQQ